MSMTETNKNKGLVRWLTPAVALLIGVAYLVAGLLGDNTGFGIFGLVVMLATGVLFLVLGRFSETAAGLRDRNDERINRIDREASLYSGMVVLLAVLGMFVGRDRAGPGRVAVLPARRARRLTYLVALVVLRYRG